MNPIRNRDREGGGDGGSGGDGGDGDGGGGGGEGGGFGSGCSGGDPIKVVLFPPLLWICLAKIAQL